MSSPITVTTAVPGVSPTQTHTISATTLPPAGGGLNAGAPVTVSAYSVLVNSTAFEYPNIVLGTMIRILEENAATPTNDALIPWGSPLRVVVPTISWTGFVLSDVTPTTLPLDASLSANTTPTAGQGTGSAITNGSVKTSTSVSKPSSSPGLGGGAVAGVAIGCLVAGALVAFAIAFFCFRRRRNSRYNDHSPTSTTVIADLKGYDAPLPPPLSAADSSLLGKFLLDSTSDEEMAAELRALGTLIQSHAENNYHSGAVLVNKNTLSAALTQLGVQRGGSLGPSDLASLALAPATRQVALQHVISQVVFTSVDTSARSQLSMLPSPVAAFLQSIPPPENGNSADGKSCHRLCL